ncbi:Carbonyl reductase [NADPH] 1 [Channa argus]|uniref:Carbonyl reductase [NADPH] 1 n=1 Tax=Channa argus TaxID=215402 RepID=A0A6G1QC01_CHAAH|nr:Carbonyl reductase [NADPH] 1 [Channa argus]
MAAHSISILITGANRGLGLEMVKQMIETAQPVKNLFACCRDPDGPKSEVKVSTSYLNFLPYIMHRNDACDHDSIKQAAKQVYSVTGAGGLNLLINNAGILFRDNVQTTTPENMQDTFNTNVLAPVLITQEFTPLLRTASKASMIPGMSCRKAAVINISALLASFESVKRTYNFLPALSYRISKASLNMLTVCAAEELKKDGILFAALHPGWVRTDMGGEGGDIDAQESVKGMLAVMTSLSERENGAFLDYQGKTLPW